MFSVRSKLDFLNQTLLSVTIPAAMLDLQWCTGVQTAGLLLPPGDC